MDATDVREPEELNDVEDIQNENLDDLSDGPTISDKTITTKTEYGKGLPSDGTADNTVDQQSADMLDSPPEDMFNNPYGGTTTLPPPRTPLPENGENTF